ncbi:hypothetical protein V6N11_074047 [Hibiscus sabdariffa]
MLPRLDTRSSAGMPIEDQNADVGLIRNDGLPPPPPIPPVGRGAGNVHQAPQGINFGDMMPLIQAMTSTFQAAVAGVNVRAPTLAAVVNPELPLEHLRSLGGAEF